MADGKSKFWAVVCGIGSAPVALAAGLANGAYEAASGKGTFDEGVNKTAEKVIDAAYEFGETNGGAMTKALVGGVLGGLGRTAIDRSINHHRD